jgi:hypothetical protein
MSTEVSFVFATLFTATLVQHVLCAEAAEYGSFSLKVWHHSWDHVLISDMSLQVPRMHILRTQKIGRSYTDPWRPASPFDQFFATSLADAN